MKISNINFSKKKVSPMKEFVLFKLYLRQLLELMCKFFCCGIGSSTHNSIAQNFELFKDFGSGDIFLS